MKLWFKLFISSVLIVITAVNVTMTWMLSTNLSAMLANERENAAVHHEYLCTLIKDAVAYERLSTDAFMVTEDEIANIAEKIFMAQLREGSSAVLFDESQSAITDNTDEFSISDMLSAANDEKTVSSAIKKIQTENGEDYLIVCCSLIRLEGKNYYLTDSRNISEIYRQNREQERLSQLASIISTVLFSVVLLIVTKLFLRPLDRVNHTLKVIAGGNYSKRLKVKGSEEFRSLSENVNLMAQSVEENYNKIQSVADERKQFIDSLSHEIKTPLTSVLGFAELMRMKPDLSSDEVLDYSSIIAEEAARLRSLSGKMMELVSTGNGSLEKHFVRLDELLTEISVVFEPIIKAKGVKLNVLIAGHNAIADFKHADGAVKRLLDGYNLINVKQGYAKCCTAVVDDNSVITADESIYKAAVMNNINCLKITPGHIDLCERYYGFIGGCSFKPDNNTIVFTGDIDTHPDSESIISFCTERNVKVESLTNKPLFDVGGVIII